MAHFLSSHAIYEPCKSYGLACYPPTDTTWLLSITKRPLTCSLYYSLDSELHTSTPNSIDSRTRGNFAKWSPAPTHPCPDQSLPLPRPEHQD
ncbi:hypothetical protein BC939DRAFT_439817 [Gamsiella multidivaricata]|uniref:uncharacterized protein n=1 Tax=Gamsiella multidivaricata TaxID=101098 RepID=UPI0022206AE4|nr:uncharacterized protein BC939DRAFT_439817 [Gamsiella multidivaricata]KAI7830196.1 hypothetical protein BC939DRAFT_439817 [Gamsiella multidivaricata]